MFMVKTTRDTEYSGHYASSSADKGQHDGSQDTCEKLAANANAKAEALGIATRYEVVEVS